MHYVCSHYEFEHGDADVDAECSAGRCPSASASLADGRDSVIATAQELSTEAASGAPWSNATLHESRGALGAWLADANGYYTTRHRVPPGNGGEVVNGALRAATVYEWPIAARQVRLPRSDPAARPSEQKDST